MSRKLQTVDHGREAIAAVDMRQAIVAYGNGTLQTWREALAELDERLSGYQTPDKRSELAGLAEHMRWAIGAFEAAMTDRTSALMDRDPDQVSWFDLSAEFARDEAAGWQAWERAKAIAADDLAGGRTAGAVVEGINASPLQRAQFVAQRAALADGLRPANGLEWTLVDSMAQALVMHRHWLHRHVVTDSVDARRVQRDTQLMGDWQPPRLSDVEAVDRAAAMADRFMRTFLRLLKTYRDGRRLVNSLTIAGGQVNIGEQQLIAPVKEARTNRTAKKARAHEGPIFDV